jgi:hypothetical protein
MLEENMNQSEGITILIASNFFLWAAIFDLTDSDSMIFPGFLLLSLASLVYILQTDPINETILRKLIGFVLINYLGIVILIENVKHSYEDEFDIMIFYSMLQFFMVIIAITALLVIKKIGKDNE